MADSKFIKKLKMHKPEKLEYSVNVSDLKRKTKFIKKVERLIRSSMEYKDYIRFLREYVDMDSCAFFQHVTSKADDNPGNKKIKIEIHHEPLTLYDYVAVVLEKYIAEGQEINAMYIAEDVMELHYMNEVGLIPLSKTIHQIVHNTQKVTIPIFMCYGAYTEFLREYGDYVDLVPNLRNKIERKVKETKDLTPESFDALTKQFTYLEVEGRKNNLDKLEVEVSIDADFAEELQAA